MPLIAYQALLSNPENLAQVRAARREIEQVGGKVSIAAPNKSGLTLVIIELPQGYAPNQFVPGVPFYPV